MYEHSLQSSHRFHKLWSLYAWCPYNRVQRTHQEAVRTVSLPQASDCNRHGLPYSRHSARYVHSRAHHQIKPQCVSVRFCGWSWAAHQQTQGCLGLLSEFVILDGIPKNIWNSRLLPSTISSRFISFTNYYFSYRVIQNLFRLQFLPDSYTVDS